MAAAGYLAVVVGRDRARLTRRPRARQAMRNAARA